MKSISFAGKITICKKNISTEGIDSNFFVILTPNPATTLVKVSHSPIENTDGKIEIRNVLGELLFEQELHPNSFELNIDTKYFESGIYYVLLNYQNNYVAKNKLLIIKQ